MAEDSRDKSERRLRLDQMPVAVKRLVDTMIGIDPNFEIEDWLIQKANEDLALIELDIERERKQLEQRIYRLESLAKRLAPEDIREVPKGQTNLFDCFDIPLPLKHLTNRIEDITDEEPHPAGTFINLLPNDGCDDPLLAVTAQMMLIVAQEKVGKGASWIDLEDLFSPLLENGISQEECDEALDHLLITSQIHEIDDDCFIPDE
ncbi:MAG: hypothetical protein MK197_01280 [Candidatus Poseidoniaceae archaeon]|nr:hypothetical protein [Candidatus Poseidoniaceae archaeon]